MTAVLGHAGNHTPAVPGAWNDPSMALSTPSRPIVGRTAEIGRLRRVLGLDGRRPKSATILVNGDAGIGKSRLVAEVARETEEAGWQVTVGHGVGQAGSTMPYLPFTELISDLAGRHPELTSAVQRTHPALGRLLPPSVDTGPGPDAPTEPQRVAEAVHALLSAVGAERPTLVVIEDVHWADESSRDLVTLLLTRGFPADHPVAVLVTCRTDDLHRGHPLHETMPVWARLPGLLTLNLGPLPDPDMAALIVTLSDRATLDHPAMGDLIARVQGNAFFAEELVASGAEGDWRNNGLGRLLRLRVDSLPEPAKQVVRAAAIGGRSVPHELLARVSGLDEDEFDLAVAAAVDHHILVAEGDGYRFRHALLGEAVATDLLPGARRRLHTAYVESARSGLARLSNAELSRHAAAIGDLEVAREAGLAAGESAMRMGGPRDALGHFQQVLGWLADDPAAMAPVARRAATAALFAGEQVRSIDLLRDALEALPPGVSPQERALLLTELAARYRILDLPADPHALTAEAMALLGPEVDDDARLQVLIGHLHTLMDRGQVEEATELSVQAQSLAADLGKAAKAADVRLAMARILEHDGDTDLARRELTAVAQDSGGLQGLAAMMRIGLLEHKAGYLAESLAWYLRGVEASRRNPFGPFALECRVYGGLTAWEHGQWDLAAELMTAQPDTPSPGRELMQAARLILAADRHEDVDPARILQLRASWEVDSLIAAYLLYAGIDLHGDAGRVEELVELVETADAILRHSWGPYQGSIRVAALLLGQAANHADHPDADLRTRLQAVAERIAGDADEILTGEPVRPQMRPGPDALAWAARLTAERLRLAAARGEGPDADALVEAWRECLRVHDELDHRAGGAYAARRLGEVLAQVGRTQEAAAATADARRRAEALGVSLPEPARPKERAAEDLTPREREILTEVARGLSNGQIGKRLYISPKTVSVHVSNVLAKLGAGSRGEAAAIARDKGLLD